ncbi:MAG TPA: flagellar biosynthesis protein FlhF [Pirellulales bacterium]|jgi:flagellar biosynthesis protein FlhF|nr:flagellar biosynthesis protein FlhF [Pirellulales bacterium]
MDVRTYRARSMQEALDMVRRELGPEASVLQTRDVRSSGLFRLMPAMRRVEVTASASVNVPSRLPRRARGGLDLSQATGLDLSATPELALPPAPEEPQSRNAFRDELKGRLTDLHSMVEDLCRRSQRLAPSELPGSLFTVFTDLIEAGLGEDLARELVGRVQAGAPSSELADAAVVKERLARMVEDELDVSGPLDVQPGKRRLVALVGPTGVGKTTTIAKLAATFRLREKRKVGLITVDTYRIAAVEQLRTYADIIDLPMAVVSTPREMREAVAGMSQLDLILMDTAGRSPRDDLKIQELKAMLAEAEADEVHLVLSSVAGATTLARTAEQFAAVGATGLMLTKLDEVANLGHVLPLVRSSRLPLSYVTDGQNVPDDIRPADKRHLARLILGLQ